MAGPTGGPPARQQADRRTAGTAQARSGPAAGHGIRIGGTPHLEAFLRVEVVRDREARIRVYLADLKTLSAIPEDAFLQNRERQYAVLHAVQLAIEASVDIATQIRAADDLGIPASYAEAFDLLETHRVVDVGLATDMRATDMRAMARFRNRIVHFYGAVDAVPRTTPMSPILGFGSWDLDLGIWDLLCVDLRALQLAAEVHVDRLPLREHVERRDARLAVAVAGRFRAAEGQVDFRADG